jgi:hypothetical protein
MVNSSNSTSSQTAAANISQQYAGTCDIICDNSISNVNMDFIDSVVTGGVNLTQSCTVNAPCLFNVMQNASADVIFKATNTAGSAGGILPQISWNNSNTSSYQNISENISQGISQQCDLSSVNSLNGVNVYAQNSTIGGGINITQTGDTAGSCTLNAGMSAAEIASGTADNCSTAGKKAKKGCGGKGGGSTASMVIGVIIVVVLVMVVTRAMRGSASPQGTPSTVSTIKTAVVNSALNSASGNASTPSPSALVKALTS